MKKKTNSNYKSFSNIFLINGLSKYSVRIVESSANDKEGASAVHAAFQVSIYLYTLRRNYSNSVPFFYY